MPTARQHALYVEENPHTNRIFSEVRSTTPQARVTLRYSNNGNPVSNLSATVCSPTWPRFSVLCCHMRQARSTAPYEQHKLQHRFTPCINSTGHSVQLTIATQAKCHSRPADYATINTITSFQVSVVTIWQRIQKMADAADRYQAQTVLENNTVKPACKRPEYFHLQASPVVYTGTDLRDCVIFLPKTGFGSNQVPFKTCFILISSNTAQ
jgi:hypothetical protein